MSRTKENIYQRKDGRWEGRFIDGIRDDGKPRYRSVYGRTYKEVRGKMPAPPKEKLISQVTNNSITKPAYDWLNSLKSNVKESSLSNYIMKVEKHIIPYFGDIDYTRITSDDIYEFVNVKLNDGLTPKYVSDILIVLKSIFKYACDKNGVYNPAANVRPPKISGQKKEICMLSEYEQSVLGLYVEKHQNNTTLGIALALYLGIRLGELCGLKWSDINFEKKTLTINRTVQRISDTSAGKRTRLIITAPKSRSSIREIPLTKRIIKLLGAFYRERDVYIISGTDKPVEPRTMQNRFKAVLKIAGLPSINFHALRHMFATNCIKHGCDVKTLSEILGHSSVEITLNKYVHSSLERKREFMERLHYAA